VVNNLPMSALRSEPHIVRASRSNSRYFAPSPTIERGKSAERVAGRASPSGKSAGLLGDPLLWSVSLFLLIQVGSGTFIIPLDAEDPVRVAGLLVLIPFVWRKKRAGQWIDVPNQALQRRNHAVFTELLIGYFFWAFSSTLLHGAIGQMSLHLVGIVFLLIVVRVLSSDGGIVIARVVPVILGSALVLSAGMGILDPTQGLAGGRLRGPFANANLLGFYAFIALLSGLLLIRRRFWSLVLCSLSIMVIAWTGSRSSAIAALSGVLLLALFRNRRSRWVVWVIVGVAAMALVGFMDPSASPLLFRDWGSRDGSAQEAFRVLSVSPFLGVGFGGELVEVASSPLRAFVEGGILALAGVVIMYMALLRAAFRRNAFLGAITCAAILSSLGEAWFLSAIGSMMLVFAALWIGVSSRYANSEMVLQEGRTERHWPRTTMRPGGRWKRWSGPSDPAPLT
jgi:hypothetical protein